VSGFTKERQKTMQPSVKSEESMSEWKTHEGVSIEVPYKGSVINVLNNLLGGLRSGMTYCGARNISELQEKAHFIRITQAGYIEGTPHAKMSKI